MASPIPYCGQAPDPADLLGRWNADPVLVAGLAVVALGFALDWRRRAGRRRQEAAAFAIAWAILVVLFVSPLCAWSSSLFSVRVAHHVALVAVVAPLLAAARPWPSGPSRMPAFSLHAAVLWAWHAPGLYALALAHDAVFWAMQLSLLGSAFLAWRVVLDAADGRWPGHAVAGVAGTIAQMGFLGALITFAGRPLYAPHLATTAAWGLSPLEDQQLGGLLMWVPAMLPYLAAGLWMVSRLLRDGGATPARSQR